MPPYEDPFGRFSWPSTPLFLGFVSQSLHVSFWDKQCAVRPLPPCDDHLATFHGRAVFFYTFNKFSHWKPTLVQDLHQDQLIPVLISHAAIPSRMELNGERMPMEILVLNGFPYHRGGEGDLMETGKTFRVKYGENQLRQALEKRSEVDCIRLYGTPSRIKWRCWASDWRLFVSYLRGTAIVTSRRWPAGESFVRRDLGVLQLWSGKGT